MYENPCCNCKDESEWEPADHIEYAAKLKEETEKFLSSIEIICRDFREKHNL